VAPKGDCARRTRPASAIASRDIGKSSTFARGQNESPDKCGPWQSKAAAARGTLSGPARLSILRRRLREAPTRTSPDIARDEAVKRAGLDSVPGRRRPSMHDLRHVFASMLIAQGLDVVFVSRQLGPQGSGGDAPGLRRRVRPHPPRRRGEARARRLEASWKQAVATAANRGTYGGVRSRLYELFRLQAAKAEPSQVGMMRRGSTVSSPS
jgi:hypothetical protein